MRHIISLLVSNESGALARVSALFSTRGYNIESLTVAPTDDPSLSRMTLVTAGSEEIIEQIKRAVTIPVMAKARIGHFVEAQILESIGVDYIDESEVLTPADEEHHINKHKFGIPFVCGCRNLGEALRRIAEGAAWVAQASETTLALGAPYGAVQLRKV